MILKKGGILFKNAILTLLRGQITDGILTLGILIAPKLRTGERGIRGTIINE